MVNLYEVKEVICIFQNLLNSSLSKKIINLIMQISKIYEQVGRFDILEQVYEEIIKKVVLNQLSCRVSLDELLDLSFYFIRGFQGYRFLSNQNLRVIMGSFKYYKREDQKYRQQLTNFINAILGNENYFKVNEVNVQELVNQYSTKYQFQFTPRAQKTE